MPKAFQVVVIFAPLDVNISPHLEVSAPLGIGPEIMKWLSGFGIRLTVEPVIETDNWLCIRILQGKTSQQEKHNY